MDLAECLVSILARNLSLSSKQDVIFSKVGGQVTSDRKLAGGQSWAPSSGLWCHLKLAWQVSPCCYWFIWKSMTKTLCNYTMSACGQHWGTVSFASTESPRGTKSKDFFAITYLPQLNASSLILASYLLIYFIVFFFPFLVAGSLGIKRYLLHGFRDVRDRERIQVERLLWSSQTAGRRAGFGFLYFLYLFWQVSPFDCCFCICGRLASCISQAVQCAKATGCISLKIIKTGFNPRPDTFVEVGI